MKNNVPLNCLGDNLRTEILEFEVRHLHLNLNFKFQKNCKNLYDSNIEKY